LPTEINSDLEVTQVSIQYFTANQAFNRLDFFREPGRETFLQEITHYTTRPIPTDLSFASVWIVNLHEEGSFFASGDSQECVCSDPIVEVTDLFGEFPPVEAFGEVILFVADDKAIPASLYFAEDDFVSLHCSLV